MSQQLCPDNPTTSSDACAASNISIASPGESETPFVGVRLRTLRHGRGLSQRELARRSGVTNGMISLIEQNKTSPSVALLKKVLNGFPISLAEFFSESDEAEVAPVFFSVSQQPLIGNGEILFRRIGGPLKGRAMQIMTETYPPGSDTGETMLSHEAEEGGFIINGRIEITVGHQSATLGPGDAYYFDSRLPHRFRNIGDETCELVSACSPPSF